MSWPEKRPPLRFATQALLVQVAVLLLIMGSGFALVAYLLHAELEKQYEQRALAVARSVAADEQIVHDVAARERTPRVQQRAEAVRRRTGVLFVVVADDHGIRYAHPDAGRLGQRVSTEPEALSGREIVTFERGTLGLSARGKVPLLSGGRVVGQVSVGIAAGEVTRRIGDLMRPAAAFTGLALLFGVAAAAGLARRLKRQTLGLEPTDLADLLREREAVLHGIDEGVLAVDPAGRITICNDAAARLIGGRPAQGSSVRDAGLPPGLRTLLAERTSARGVLVATEDRMLVVTAAPVRRGDQDLGHVLTLRDRTDLDAMARELDVVRALSDALRAQAHEYTNRLHTLSGLLSLGHREEAITYLRELADDPLATEYGDGGRLRDPYIRGLLAAKTAVASEHGVDLRLSPDSFVPAQLRAPLDVVTILGNLVDNATAAAQAGARRPAWVEVSLLAEADILHIVVVDSGDGVPPEAVDRIFDQDFTTAADDVRPHGVGLALARRLTRRHCGDLALTRACGADCGAVFVARLPGAFDARGPEPRQEETVTAVRRGEAT
ncbi:sensor histidine kinase [Sphaerisporangium fuscum]|uniref:sensor histidine kinase n=1 Tax=Sphaerisporangium fuscum TaxID=2835868 RepID=UPI001BDCF023|nr:sensor histidine kinase [Sphaerisporangium fuscum]